MQYNIVIGTATVGVLFQMFRSISGYNSHTAGIQPLLKNCL